MALLLLIHSRMRIFFSPLQSLLLLLTHTRVLMCSEDVVGVRLEFMCATITFAALNISFLSSGAIGALLLLLFLFLLIHLW